MVSCTLLRINQARTASVQPLMYPLQGKKKRKNNMAEILMVNDKNYWKHPVKPRNYSDWVDMYEGNGRMIGLWELVQWNDKTGKVAKRIWNKNVITDQGAQNILQRAVNSLAATLPALFNNILMTNNSGSTTLTGAGFTAGQTGITALPCAALPAAIPSGTYLILDYGTGNAQGGYNASGVLPVGVNAIITNGATAQGATSITVLSFTSANAHSAGAAIVPVPMYTDNPANSAAITSNATTPLTSFSGNLAVGAFVFTPTTGQWNRQDVVTFQFTNAGGVPTGNYTD